MITADQNFFDSLDESSETTRKSLNKEHLDDINGMREKIDQVEGTRFDELLPEVEDDQYDKAIKEYLNANKQDANQETLDKILRETCTTLNEIWAPTIMKYYQEIDGKLLTLNDVKNHNEEGYKMLLNAGYCHNVYNVAS